MDGSEHYDALIHFYFHVDPDTLTPDKWAKLKCRLDFALEFDGKMTKKKTPPKQ